MGIRAMTAGLVLCAVMAGGMAFGQVPGMRLYVSPGGDDTATGAHPTVDGSALEGPLATLEGARRAVRRHIERGGVPAGGIEVLLRGGEYPLADAVRFEAADSGRAGAPVVYRAVPGETVVLSGGRTVGGFGPVTDPDALQRLDPEALPHVVQADLRAAGVTEYGEASDGALQVYFRGRPMTLSRWPNEGFVKIAGLVEKDGHKIHGIPGSLTGKFNYAEDRPARWVDEKDPWLHGYWFWDWSDQRQKIAAISTETKTIEVAQPYHSYGYRVGQWYYAFNMLCELDSPGEWHVDREKGLLFFWPPEPLTAGDVMVSLVKSAAEFDGASHITLRGLTFEGFRGTALRVSGGGGVRIAGCTLRNISGGAVGVGGGTGHTVYGCDIYGMGHNGISLNGGDRTTLTPAGHTAENNHIRDYGRWSRMYQTAVYISGVGNRVLRNLIHDAPHMAVGFSGNDHLIEGNEIHHVCLESNDAGAIYAGRDWTMRGNVIRGNYLHDIQGFENRGCVGVYLDDMFAAADITHNLFVRVTAAAFIGGGRDCAVENNIFVDCTPAVHVDARALGWAHYHADEWIKEAEEKGTLSGIAYNKPPYSERYPELPRILDEEPKAPRGIRVARNICAGGKWDRIEEKARPGIAMTDNLLDADPKFVDPEKGDYRLRPDSPALALGFEPLDFGKMGIYASEERASAVE
ncbi:MAG: right-handed parallel beta-helix repeat-containing protein [Candidatus Hydrogenedentes bacterium]|nr:right-handed parallel beta-helix repeat-containing protein [Candidatus Hydrogenedentota bacterium]